MVDEVTKIVSCEPAQDVEGRDVRLFKAVIFKLVRHIDRAAELCNSGASEEKLQKLEKTVAVLFGKKSLVTALCELADLSSRIDQLFPQAKAEPTEDPFAQYISAADIAIVENFIKKQKAVN